jgi:hypothetical protein
MKKIIFEPNNEISQMLGAAPQSASNFMPDWFKKLTPFKDGKRKFSFPQSGRTAATVKKCMPFLDALSSGYMITLEQEVYVENTENGKSFRWQDTNKTLVGLHGPFQYEGFEIPNNFEPTAFKWSNYWSIVPPKGYSLLFSHPLNRLELPFYTLSGVVDADNFMGVVNFPFFIKKDFEGIIESGTPIAQVIPIKRENWKSEVINMKKDKSIKHDYQSFTSIFEFYKKNFWVKKDYS